MAEVSGPANGQHIICHLNYVGKGPIQYIVARHSDFTPSTSLAKNARDRTFLPNSSISWKTLAFAGLDMILIIIIIIVVMAN